ncbi:ABC transporter B family member 21-like protein, partial [Tanacetum coccineum]
RSEYMLMFADTVGAAVNEVCMPLLTLFFGDLIDSFGDNENNNDVVKAVSKCRSNLFTWPLLLVIPWMVTRERQAARIRNLYLKTILRQDISFFDKERNTGEVACRMSGDTSPYKMLWGRRFYALLTKL